MKRYTSFDLPNVELIDESPFSNNRKAFFNYVKNIMTAETTVCSVLEFNTIDADLGGFFNKVVAIPKIVLPEDCAELTDNSIKFNDDKKFAIFIHEASHFLHFIADHGVFKADSLKDHKPAIYKVGEGFTNASRTDLEYEAGYRSLYYNLIYGMFDPADRTVIETNLINMLNYFYIENQTDIIKNYMKGDQWIDEPCKEACERELKDRKEKWMKTVTSWYDLKDYTIKI